MKKLFIIGSGGHSRVVLDSINNNDYEISIIDFYNTDNDKNFNYLSKNYQIKSFHDLASFKYKKNFNIYFHIAIGDNILRSKYYLIFKNFFKSLSILDKSSIISKSAKISKGTFIGKNSVINANVRIQENCIVNTSVIVEHDCRISMNSHLCPGVIIAGSVKIGKNSLLGIGSKVLPNIVIGSNCNIGAGSIVNKNLKNNTNSLPSGLKIRINI